MRPSDDLESFIALLLNDVGGDWFLAGGALVRLEYDVSRSTHDIDLAFLSHAELSPILAYQRVLQKLSAIGEGAGADDVNLAIAPFLEFIPGWRDEIVELRRGRRGALYRPNFSLFAFLKIGRGSEVDFRDLRAAFAKAGGELDAMKLRGWIDSHFQAKTMRANWKKFAASVGLSVDQ